MAHLFDCIGGSVRKFVQQQLQADSSNIFDTSGNKENNGNGNGGGGVRIKLRKAVLLLEKWCDVPRTLTSQVLGIIRVIFAFGSLHF
jgi:hypothetical protein